MRQGIETATFHILTPYPGTRLYQRLSAEHRVTSHDWDRYDTRHAVFKPAQMTAARLEAGYRDAYRQFYSWRNVGRAAWTGQDAREKARHLAYTVGWKKLEPMWDLAIRSGHVHTFLPLLEAILDRFGSGGGAMPGRLPAGGTLPARLQAGGAAVRQLWPRPGMRGTPRRLGELVGGGRTR